MGITANIHLCEGRDEMDSRFRGKTGGRPFDRLRMSGQLRCGRFCGVERGGSRAISACEWAPAFAGVGKKGDGRLASRPYGFNMGREGRGRV